MKKFLLFAAAALASSSAFAAEKVLAEMDFTTADGYYFWKSDATNAELKDGALVVTNAEATANFWDVQYMVADGFALTDGTEYTIDVKIKDFKGVLHYNLGTWDANVMGGADVELSANWQNVVMKATPTKSTDGTAHLLLQTGDFAGTYSIASVKITYNDEGGETPVDPVTPGKEGVIAEMYPGPNGLIGWGGNDDVAGSEYVGEEVEVDGRKAYKITHAAACHNSWEAQFAFDHEYVAGTTYYFSLDVKGDPGTITSGFQLTGDWIACGDVEPIIVTSEWTSIVVKGTAKAANGKNANRWVANVGDYVGTLYISNMVISDDDPSAVETIAPVKVATGVYNLNGVKVADELNSNLPKGIYIVNGKKVVR